MKQKSAVFTCGSLSLEGIWHLPGGSEPLPAVVVCHPHPLYGGDMHNNVVEAVCQAVAGKNIIAFRFNFRGAGRSQGSFSGGVEEQDDVAAALSFVSSAKAVDASRVGLCGYSFGASVALSLLSRQSDVPALALISPPLAVSPLLSSSQGIMSYSKPKLVMVGSVDFVASPDGVLEFVRQLPPPKEHEVVSGADHFWAGYEERLAQRVADFFAAALPQ